MSFPTRRGTASWQAVSSRTDHYAQMPASVVAGDLIVVVWMRGAVNNAGTLDGKWTNFSPAGIGIASALNGRCAYAVADGSESGALLAFTTVTGGARGSSITIVYSKDTWGNNPEAVATATQITGAAASCDVPALTPSFGSADTEWIACALENGAAITRTGLPTSYANAIDSTDSSNIVSVAFRDRTASSEDPNSFTWSGNTNASTFLIGVMGITAVAMADTGAGTDALAVNTVGIQMDDTGSGADALAVNTVGIQMDETGVGTDAMPQIALSGLADETGTAVDTFAVAAAIPSIDETGSGVDTFGVSITLAAIAETGAGTDGFSIEAFTALSSGHLWIGRFVNEEVLYTMQDEIINQQQLDEAALRPNVISVDGQVDSWTEYDGDDLIIRDTAINAYFDLTELKSLGDVRQRAISEEETARRANSPGGDIAWDAHYTRMDRVFWITEDGSKYETRIEGIQVEFDQGMQPFQRATVDTGLMVLCPPDEADIYLVRDLFERVTADGLGTADEGGAWVIS